MNAIGVEYCVLNAFGVEFQTLIPTPLLQVITTNGHQGKVYELAGDEAFTLTGLAAEISRQTGKDIPYKNLPVDEYANVLTGFGLPEGLAHSIAGWDVGMSKGDLFDASKQLSNLIGRPTAPMAEMVEEVVKQI